MNVKELRDALADLPDDLMVVVRGYEEGVDEVDYINRRKLKLNTGLGTWYVGNHSLLDDDSTEDAVEAVQIA